MKRSKNLLIVPVLALFLAACTHTTTSAPQEDAPPGAESETTINEGATVNPNDPAVSQIVEDGDQREEDYTISMSNFEYSMTQLTAEAGETITIRLDSEEGMHDFVIDDLDVDSGTVSEGDSATIEITIPEDAESGTVYDFYCSVGNHRDLGMEGTLTIN